MPFPSFLPTPTSKVLADLPMSIEPWQWRGNMWLMVECLYFYMIDYTRSEDHITERNSRSGWMVVLSVDDYIVSQICAFLSTATEISVPTKISSAWKCHFEKISCTLLTSIRFYIEKYPFVKKNLYRYPHNCLSWVFTKAWKYPLNKNIQQINNLNKFLHGNILSAKSYPYHHKCFVQHENIHRQKYQTHKHSPQIFLQHQNIIACNENRSLAPVK